LVTKNTFSKLMFSRAAGEPILLDELEACGLQRVHVMREETEGLTLPPQQRGAAVLQCSQAYRLRHFGQSISLIWATVAIYSFLGWWLGSSIFRQSGNHCNALFVNCF
jgi:hypothetical protein